MNKSVTNIFFSPNGKTETVAKKYCRKYFETTPKYQSADPGVLKNCRNCIFWRKQAMYAFRIL